MLLNITKFVFQGLAVLGCAVAAIFFWPIVVGIFLINLSYDYQDELGNLAVSGMIGTGIVLAIAGTGAWLGYLSYLLQI